MVRPSLFDDDDDHSCVSTPLFHLQVHIRAGSSGSDPIQFELEPPPLC